MTITSDLFEAYLKCPTKCFLRARGETTTENEYANWVRAKQASYWDSGIKDLISRSGPSDCVTNPLEMENAKFAK